MKIKSALLVSLCAASHAELFVSSHDSSQVFRFHETTGAFIDIFIPNTQPRLNAPHGLAFGPDGNLYVASALLWAGLRLGRAFGAWEMVHSGDFILSFHFFASLRLCAFALSSGEEIPMVEVFT